MNNNKVMSHHVRRRLRVRLISYLSDNSNHNDVVHNMIKNGVLQLDDAELHRLCVKYGIVEEKKRRATGAPTWPIEVRFIFLMDEYGFDETAVLEQLKEEYFNSTDLEILHSIQPFRVMASAWYDQGRSMVHGLIEGWIHSITAK